MSDTQKPNDDLLEKARRLQDKVDSLGQSSESHRKKHDFFVRFPFLASLRQRYRAVMGWLGPIGSFVGWVFGIIGKWFGWAAYRSDENGEATFSMSRLAWCSAFSGVLILLVHMALSALYYYGTAFDEVVYVTGKQEIETGELYQFGGCTSLPCSTTTDNGKFYLIESSLYFPQMYYPEENVFANIPQQDAACQVKGYGIYFRTLRWLYKSFQLYQHVTNVSCRPYTEEEVKQAMSGGDILVEQDLN
ncbi:MAG: hypothetical protein AAF438_16285 [Pseudomonadota bacterium]